ncbi:MAG: hypothetical protein EDX89_04600 [Acidobacteria bacterium]|nr:MAG: hypothetical protein EDX89_04600 [Acidobacteriota bacterium]MCE7957135.1 hypothetical protein [Acidobacteria bacterium ACB2]
MVHPSFYIRCPTCRIFWVEQGTLPPGTDIITRCIRCRREVAVSFCLDCDRRLTIREVSDVANGKRGGWAPALAAHIHWREVN